MHTHGYMEIVAYVRQGLPGHRDTLGSEGTNSFTRLQPDLIKLHNSVAVVASGDLSKAVLAGCENSIGNVSCKTSM
jgi:hypothetical protein